MKKNTMNNRTGFNTLYAWGDNKELGCSPKEFENVMFSFIHVRIKFHKCIKNNGATDVVFFVHDDDITKLMNSPLSSAIKRYIDVNNSSSKYTNERLVVNI